MLDGDVVGALIRERIVACELACDEVIAVSERCADACLALHGDGDITTCFLADLDCVVLGTVTVRVLSWTTSANRSAAIAVLEACVEVCTASAAACEQMVQLHSPWVTCTGACHRLCNACTDLLVVLEA
ncbi:four-helix bundle copper-binding protein [Cryobacterium sp. N22]|uniref:four-helix bundle copper-binding protein n=1 Tax=Cryobacterium sp. N22 TaxID=2048290 RepID=UPI000CE2F640|nr:four-helix bundle copper-binding protein [Cryobacterium sp. N22]